MQLDLRNIRFLGRYRENEISGILSLADVLFLHLKDDPILKITVPHSRHSYTCQWVNQYWLLLAVKLRSWLQRLELVFQCQSNDARDLSQKMLAMSQMEIKVLEKMGCEGRSLACSTYSKTVIAKQYIDVFRKTKNLQ